MRFWCFALAALGVLGEEIVSHRPANEPSLDYLSDEDRNRINESREKNEFQAEISRLMDIIVNSLYTNKEVFMRELIANAADALEKVRFLAVGQPSILDANPDLEIYIEIDQATKTLSFTDTGIGMTKSELISNLGTIAKSGSNHFLEAVAHGETDVNLIGQFGVGFYSSFLVSDMVTVTSRHLDDEQHIWESSADASFSVAADPRGNSLVRGTRVTLHLREDSQQFLDAKLLEPLVKRNSEFVGFPVFFKRLEGENSEWVHMNTNKAIWLRPKEDIQDEEYKNFFKTVWKHSNEPLAYSHFSAEGEVEFRSILYIPPRSDDLYSRFQQANSPEDAPSFMRLYVRRVLIGDDKLRLLPSWLNFIAGVVDSDDLPLKVDREQLSQNRVLQVVQKKLIGKALEMFRTAAREADAKVDTNETTPYDQMIQDYESFLYLGCVEDADHRNKIARLLRFRTSKSLRPISIDRYIARMKPGQEAVYFLAGDTEDLIASSPFIEPFTARDFEVIYLTDALGEACLERIRIFEGKTILSIEKGTRDLLVVEDEAVVNSLNKSMKKFCSWWSEVLTKGDRQVKEVKPSLLLVDSPALVSSDTWGMSGHYEKIMRSQAWFNEKYYESQLKSRSLDINPKHPIIKRMYNLWMVDDANTKLAEAARNIFDAAQLAAGHVVKSPAAVAKRAMQAVAVDLEVSKDELADSSKFTLMDLADTAEEIDLSDDRDEL